MDTKWKKSKMVLSLLSFVCGVSLFIGCVVANPFRFLTDKGEWKVYLLPGTSYMDQAAFIKEVNWRFLNLIRIGAGEEMLERLEFESLWEAQKEAESSARGPQDVYYLEEVVEAGAQTEEDIAQDMAETVPAFQQSNETDAAAQYQQLFGTDKNLLYEVYRDGELLFENRGLLALDDYSLVLHFQKDGTTLISGGTEKNLIEKTNFSGAAGQWLVPGYENYPVTENYEDIEVYLWVRQKPQLFYSALGYEGHEMLHLSERFEYRRQFVRCWCAAASMGILCFWLAFVLRRYHAEASRQIGTFLGQTWFEVKLIGAGIWVWLRLFFWWDFESSNWMVLGYALGCVWILWLLLLDIKYCPKLWNCSLAGKIVQIWRASHMKLSIQKRLVRQSMLPLIFGGIAIFFLFTVMINNRIFSGNFMEVYAVLAILSLGGFVVTLIWNFWMLNGLAEDLGLLDRQLEMIEQGAVPYAYEMPLDGELAEMSERLSEIHLGLERAVQERMKSERMKVELVTNVSHEIKTPLTSIISYVDLLKKEENLPEDVKDYIEILALKSERLRAMVQDVFEVSKAVSGQLPVNMEKLDLAKLLRQTLADMQEKIDNAPVILRTDIPEAAVWISADGQRMYRVFQNLLENALAYSLEGSRIYVRLRMEKDTEGQNVTAVADIRNTSRQELDGMTDFTERFVRGDKSRTDGGSGLGLSIAKSFTEACGGKFEVEAIADLFVVTVRFSLE